MDLQQRVSDAEQRASDLEQKVSDANQKAKYADQRAADAEHRTAENLHYRRNSSVQSLKADCCSLSTIYKQCINGNSLKYRENSRKPKIRLPSRLKPLRTFKPRIQSRNKVNDRNRKGYVCT